MVFLLSDCADVILLSLHCHILAAQGMYQIWPRVIGWHTQFLQVLQAGEEQACQVEAMDYPSINPSCKIFLLRAILGLDGSMRRESCIESVFGLPSFLTAGQM